MIGLYGAMVRLAYPQRRAPYHPLAVHEIGHAATSWIFGEEIARICLSPSAGTIERHVALNEGLETDFDRQLYIHLSGRTAERLVFRNVSRGAGSGAKSDLGQAARMTLAMDHELGLGAFGKAWFGPQDPARLAEPERKRLREKLDYAEEHARALLYPHQLLLQDMAAALVQEREVDAEVVQSWLRDVPQKGDSEQFLYWQMRGTPSFSSKLTPANQAVSPPDLRNCYVQTPAAQAPIGPKSGILSPGNTLSRSPPRPAHAHRPRATPYTERKFLISGTLSTISRTSGRCRVSTQDNPAQYPVSISTSGRLPPTGDRRPRPMARDRKRHAKSQQAPETPARRHSLQEGQQMPALSEEDLLTTDEAVAYLARFKIFTSRSGLDTKFKTGDLARVEVSGRVRILYRPQDLLEAFFKGEVKKCPSKFSGAKTAKARPAETTTSAARSPGSPFTRALALATSVQRKSSKPRSRKTSSTGRRLVSPQR